MNIPAPGPPAAPILSTPRLRLRPHRPDDLDARAAMTADDRVMHHFPVRLSREENWARLLLYAGHWAQLGWGPFAVEQSATGAWIGEVGLVDFRRGLGADFDHAPEACWILAYDAQGRGFAREAARAAIDWYVQRFGPTRLVCMIAPDNVGSVRLAAELGFEPFSVRAYRGRAMILHERPARGS